MNEENSLPVALSGATPESGMEKEEIGEKPLRTWLAPAMAADALFFSLMKRTKNQFSK